MLGRDTLVFTDGDLNGLMVTSAYGASGPVIEAPDRSSNHIFW